LGNFLSARLGDSRKRAAKNTLPLPVVSLLFILLANSPLTAQQTYSLSGNIRFAGIPISNLTSTQPDIWCRNESTGKGIQNISWTYDDTTGNYSIDGLPPEQVGINVWFHAVGEKPTLPGNYRTWQIVDMKELTSRNQLHADIDVSQIIHMTGPWDNDAMEFSTRDPVHTYQGRILFQWDPVWQAKSYIFSITRKRDPDHRDGYGQHLEIIVYKFITDPFYTVDLEPSKELEHYTFNVTALDGSDRLANRLGHYMTTYTNGHVWEYRFKVTDKPLGETVNIIRADLPLEEPVQPLAFDQTHTLAGTIRYNGTPMSEITDVVPHISAQSHITGINIFDLTWTYDNTTGNYTVDGLPFENVGIGFRFHTAGEENTFPGNFVGSCALDVSMVTPQNRANFDIDVIKILHVTKPVDDNYKRSYGTRDPAPTHHSPLLLEWDHLPETAYYQVIIKIFNRDPQHTDRREFVKNIVNSEILENSFIANLDLSNDLEYYSAKIFAFNEKKNRIGYNMINYTNGYGWDYRFKISSVSPEDFLLTENESAEIDTSMATDQATTNQDDTLPGEPTRTLSPFYDTNLETAIARIVQKDDASPSALLNLTDLDAPNRAIEDLTGLGLAANLQSLNLQNNLISDISQLARLTNLQTLNLKANPLNTPAYCLYLPIIEENNPGITLLIDPNPNPLTDDCLVDLDEMIEFLSHWLEEPCNTDNNWCQGADLLHLGFVDFENFNEINFYYQKPANPESPNPSN